MKRVKIMTDSSDMVRKGHTTDRRIININHSTETLMEENQCRKTSKNHAIILDGFLCSKSTPLPILPNVKRLRIERFRDDWMRGRCVFKFHLARCPSNAAIEKSAAALRFYVARLRSFHFPSRGRNDSLLFSAED